MRLRGYRPNASRDGGRCKREHSVGTVIKPAITAGQLEGAPVWKQATRALTKTGIAISPPRRGRGPTEVSQAGVARSELAVGGVVLVV